LACEAKNFHSPNQKTTIEFRGGGRPGNNQWEGKNTCQAGEWVFHLTHQTLFLLAFGERLSAPPGTVINLVSNCIVLWMSPQAPVGAEGNEWMYSFGSLLQ
jgi:hypothetical protein